MNRNPVGPVTVNHASYRVRRGRLAYALFFFQDALGWTTSPTIVKGDWGEARFTYSERTPEIMVQLTEESAISDEPVTYPATHLALNVDDARGAAIAIRDWAYERGEVCPIEPANAEGTKWFVNLRGIFTFEIELVSRPPCPTCKGKGYVPESIQKDSGTVDTKTCPVCKGQKVDQTI